MNPELDLFCQRLLASLANGAYQGMLLLPLVWLGLKLIPRANAATRHVVLFGALLCLALLPAAHFAASAQRGGGRPSPASWKSDSTSAGAMDSITVPNDEQPAASGLDLAKGGPPVPFQPPSRSRNNPTSAATDRSLPTDLSKPAAGASIPVAGSPLARASGPASSSTEAAQPAASPGAIHEWKLSLPSEAALGVAGLWIILAGIRLAGLAWQCRRLVLLKRSAMAPPEPLRAQFESLRGSMRIRRPIRLLLTPGHLAPMVAGFWRPAILLPARMFVAAPANQTESVLRHELAHVRRWDDWTNLLEQVIKAVLFFHPAIWWVSRRLTMEREIACDDHVLSALSAPRPYALFLTELSGRMRCRDEAAAPAAWSNQNQLTERIHMILDTRRNASPRPACARAGVLTFALALLALAGWQSGPRLILADEASAAQPPIAAAPELKPEKARHAAPGQLSVPLAPALAESIPPGESGPRVKPGLRPSGEEPLPALPSALPPLAPVPEGAVPALTPHPAPRPRIVSRPAGLGNAPVFALSEAQEPRLVPEPARVPRVQNAPGDRAVMRRLERLERMVESLIEEKKESRKHDPFQDGRHFHFNHSEIELHTEALAELAEEHAKAAFGETDDLLEPEFAQRTREKAARAAERAARDAQLRSKTWREKRGDWQGLQPAQARQPFLLEKDHLAHQLRSLQNERQALQRQMEALEEQIKRLHQHQDRLHEEHEHETEHEERSESRRFKSEQENSASEDKPKAKN